MGFNSVFKGLNGEAVSLNRRNIYGQFIWQIKKVRFTIERPRKSRRCQAQHVPDNVHQLHVQQPSTYEKPEAASAVSGS